MWTLILSAALALGQEPVWTIASDGSMVELRLASAEPSPFVAKPPVDLTMQFDSKGRLVRLPGPRYHWDCPGCNDPTDTMYLGQHLRGREHRVSNTTINKVGWWQILVYHDNLHNVNYKPRPTVKARPTQRIQSSSTTCQGRACRFPRIRRLLGRG